MSSRELQHETSLREHFINQGLYNTVEKHHHKKPKPGKLHKQKYKITIQRAIIHRKADHHHTCDPWIRVVKSSVLGDKSLCVTPILRGHLNPEWNFEAIVMLRATNSIVLELYDVDKMGSSSVGLAHASISGGLNRMKEPLHLHHKNFIGKEGKEVTAEVFMSVLPVVD